MGVTNYINKRLKALGKKAMPELPPRRDFTPQECLELQEMHRIVSGRVWEYNQLKGNTALLHNGQEYVKTLKAAAEVLDQVKRAWVAKKLMECGYPENALVDVNLSTGRIFPKFYYQPSQTTDGPGDHQETAAVA